MWEFIHVSLSSDAVCIVFISTRKLNFSASVFSICSPIHVYCIPFPLFMPTFLAHVKSSSFTTKSLKVFRSWPCYFYVYFPPCPLYPSSLNLMASSTVRKILSWSDWQSLVPVSGPPTFASSILPPCYQQVPPHSGRTNTRRGTMDWSSHRQVFPRP